MGVVIFLLLFNAFLALREDLKSRAAVENLKQKLQLSAKALREGKWEAIAARELVPGDVIRIRHGDWVPADARVVGGSCGVDQSALTGESVILERPAGSLLFAASLLRRGEVTAVVSATGEKTFFGKYVFGWIEACKPVQTGSDCLWLFCGCCGCVLAGKTAKLVDESAPATHMEHVFSQVTKGVMAIVLLAEIIAVIVLFATKPASEVVDSISTLLVLIVSTIPVAFPAMYTTAMALGSHELVSKGVIVTRLAVTEDAASMTVLCSDKTGTITKNEMTVKEIVLLPRPPVSTDAAVKQLPTTDQQLLAYGVLASQLAK